MPERTEIYHAFLSGWHDQFKEYGVKLVTVFDGSVPTVRHAGKSYARDEIMLRESANYSDLIFTANDGVRNLGFAFAHRYLRPDVYLTLDDDVLPHGDTIGDHLRTLNIMVSLSWMSTASEYMRGFPYNTRDEAHVMVSHGVWQNVHDYDAPTQLVLGNRPATFPSMPIPRGIYAPICGMNLAFHSSVLAFCYFSPMGPSVNLDRFADIWMGIFLKREMDRLGCAIYTGGASCWHTRASNIWANLKKESNDGLRLNETLWQGDETDPYFDIYANKRERWRKFLSLDEGTLSKSWQETSQELAHVAV